MADSGPPENQTPAWLETLRANHPDVQLEVSQQPGGLMVQMIRVPPESRQRGLATKALTELLAYADRSGLVVALTPQRIGAGAAPKKALQAWYRKHGFVPNKGRRHNHEFMAEMIRTPPEQEQAVSVGNAESAAAPTEPGNAPVLADGLRWWVRNHGEDAARVLALVRERARRAQVAETERPATSSGPARQGSGRESLINPLDRWHGVLPGSDIAQVAERASVLRRALEGRSDAELQALETELATRDPFGALDDVVQRWQGRTGGVERSSPGLEPSAVPALQPTPDPLAPFARSLPGPQVARINNRALMLGSPAAQLSVAELRTRLSRAEDELGTEPLLRDGYRWWAQTYGEDAAKAEALARERASRAQPASGEPSRTPLDRWRGKVADSDVDRIEERAEVLHESLKGRSDRALNRLEAELKARDPFGALNAVAKRWTTRKGELAAKVVAFRRELSERDLIASVESAGVDADTPSRDEPSPPGGPAPLDRFVGQNLHRLGQDRTGLITDLVGAIKERLKHANTAVLQALRDRHEDPIASLNPKEALTTRRLERDWRNTVAARESAETHGEAAKAPGGDGDMAVAVHRAAWTQAGKRLRDLSREGERQWDRGTHLDRWMNDHAFDLASALAAEDVIADRAREQAPQRDAAAGHEPNRVAAPAVAEAGLGA